MEVPQKLTTNQKTRKAKKKHHVSTKVKLHVNDSAPHPVLETPKSHCLSPQPSAGENRNSGSRASNKSPASEQAASTARPRSPMKSPENEDSSKCTISDGPASQNGSISRSSSGQSSSRATSRSSSATATTRTHSTDSQYSRMRPATADLKVEAVRRDLARYA